MGFCKETAAEERKPCFISVCLLYTGHAEPMRIHGKAEEKIFLHMEKYVESVDNPCGKWESGFRGRRDPC